MHIVKDKVVDEDKIVSGIKINEKSALVDMARTWSDTRYIQFPLSII